MSKRNFIKGSCLAVATAMLPMSQAVMAEGTWGISGWINEGITWFDDGDDSGVGQLSDNGTTLGSRITLSGTYSPENTGLTSGFEVILEPRNSTTPLLSLNQADLDGGSGISGDGFGSEIATLSHNVHIGGSWGKFTVGKQSMPTDNIAVLADPSVTIWSGISPVFRANNFDIKDSSGALLGKWGQFSQCHSLIPGLGIGIGIDCNGIYRNGVRYDAPTIGGFALSAGWANDDIYDVALKYAGEFGDLKVQANAGYSVHKNGGLTAGSFDDTDLLQVQAGIMHVPTGLFGVATYQNEETDDVTAIANGSDDTDAYYYKAGIRTGAWTNVGDSVLYAEYGLYQDQYGLTASVTGSEFERWGIVAEQYFGARLLVYGKYEEYTLDVDGTTAFDDAEDLELFTFGITYFF